MVVTCKHCHSTNKHVTKIDSSNNKCNWIICVWNDAHSHCCIYTQKMIFDQSSLVNFSVVIWLTCTNLNQNQQQGIATKIDSWCMNFDDTSILQQAFARKTWLDTVDISCDINLYLNGGKDPKAPKHPEVMWTFMIPITFSACHSQEINAFRLEFKPRFFGAAITFSIFSITIWVLQISCYDHSKPSHLLGHNHLTPKFPGKITHKKLMRTAYPQNHKMVHSQ